MEDVQHIVINSYDDLQEYFIFSDNGFTITDSKPELRQTDGIVSLEINIPDDFGAKIIFENISRTFLGVNLHDLTLRSNFNSISSNLNAAFRNQKNLETVYLEGLYSNSDMSEMFKDCLKLKRIDISFTDTDDTTSINKSLNMTNIARNCKRLKSAHFTGSYGKYYKLYAINSFEDCTDLEVFTLDAIVVFLNSTRMFSNTPNLRIVSMTNVMYRYKSNKLIDLEALEVPHIALSGNFYSTALRSYTASMFLNSGIKEDGILIYRNNIKLTKFIQSLIKGSKVDFMSLT